MKITNFPQGLETLANVCRPRAHPSKSMLAHRPKYQPGSYVSHFYQPEPQEFQLLKENLDENAYQAAEQQSRQHATVMREKAMSLLEKAAVHSSRHFGAQSSKLITDRDQHVKFTENLVNELEEVATHIMQGGGQKGRQKKHTIPATICTKGPELVQQMPDKLSMTRLYLSRIQLSKADQKKQLKLVDASNISVSATQDPSMDASYAQEADKAHALNPLDKYMDIQKLRKRWKVDDPQIRIYLRSVLTKKCVYEAERETFHRHRMQKDKPAQTQRKKPKVDKKRAASVIDSKLTWTDRQPKSQSEMLADTVTSEWRNAGQFLPPGQLFHKTRKQQANQFHPAFHGSSILEHLRRQLIHQYSALFRT